MKKSIAVILAILTIFSLMSCATAFAADGSIVITCVDNYPITIKEVEEAKYTPVFYLATSAFDYKFEITLPDGSKQLLKYDEDSADDTTAAAAESRYEIRGFDAYVEFEDVESAWANRGDTTDVFVTVHISFKLSEKVNGAHDFKSYNMEAKKYLAPSYVTSVTPVKNAPAYIYEESESADFRATEFEIRYWNGTSKTITPEIKAVEEKIHYTLDGEKLIYDVNHKTSKIYISYFDASCYIDVAEIREFPFESIELINCELKGDMPVKLVYQINRIGQATPERYTKEVNAYSGCIDFVDGYPVSYSTEGSKYVSTVEISVGNLKDSKTYEMQQQGFLQKLIAKIVMFFKAIFSAGIF